MKAPIRVAIIGDGCAALRPLSNPHAPNTKVNMRRRFTRWDGASVEKALPGAALRIAWRNMVSIWGWASTKKRFSTGLDTGCSESAVMSGLLAAHATSQKPSLNEIIRYDHP